MKERGVTHHLRGLERLPVKVCEAEAVFWKPITVLQLLSVTRGLIFVDVSVLDKKEEQEHTEAMVTLILHLLPCKKA